jgi:CubicO group peptidase (beta-lactamase class C family)
MPDAEPGPQGHMARPRSQPNARITNLVRPFADGYGYQWWIDRRGVHTALGVSGQYIIVAPRHDLVAVFTSKPSGRTYALEQNAWRYDDFQSIA